MRVSTTASIAGGLIDVYSNIYKDHNQIKKTTTTKWCESEGTKPSDSHSLIYNNC